MYAFPLTANVDFPPDLFLQIMLPNSSDFEHFVCEEGKPVEE
jgi:hypothetical protein